MVQTPVKEVVHLTVLFAFSARLFRLKRQFKVIRHETQVDLHRCQLELDPVAVAIIREGRAECIEGFWGDLFGCENILIFEFI